MSGQLNTVPFHGEEINVVLDDQNGDLLVPMRERVEAIGLAWQPQHRKLKDPRWGCITMMVTQVGDQGRETVCLPLRKLDAWLLSIEPSKVKPDLRERLTAYQNELSEVLWQYRSRGVAINPQVQATLSLLGELDGIPQAVEHIRKHSAGAYRTGREIQDQLAVLTRTVTELVEIERRRSSATNQAKAAKPDDLEESSLEARDYIRNDDAARRLGVLSSFLWGACKTYSLPRQRTNLGFKMVHWPSVRQFFLNGDLRLSRTDGPLFSAG